MKEFFKIVKSILANELNIINKKIKGTSYLEILKINFLDKISDNKKLITLENIEELTEEFNFNDDAKSVNIKFICNKLSNSNLNLKLSNNLLLICIKENIQINLKDSLTKKSHHINLSPYTGIVLSKETNCDLNFAKDCILIKIMHEDKNHNIEKLQ